MKIPIVVKTLVQVGKWQILCELLNANFAILMLDLVLFCLQSGLG